MTARSGAAIVALLLIATPCFLAELFDVTRGVDPYTLAFEPALAPSLAHPLGTDALGRDNLSRLLHGGRVSLTVAFLGGVLALTIGGTLGLVAGYAGGALEVVLMRLTETAMALPKLPLMLVLVSVDVPSLLGLRPGAVTAIVALVLVIGLFSWMDVARLARAVTRQIRERDFVRAAEGLGLTELEVLRRHVVPHLVGPLGVAFALELGENILYESALSFLGLGVAPPTPSWGALLAQGFSRIHDAPLLVVVPGALTAVFVASVHAVAEEWRVRSDPSSARLER